MTSHALHRIPPLTGSPPHPAAHQTMTSAARRPVSSVPSIAPRRIQRAAR